MRDKLYAWQVPAKEIEAIIGQLIGEGFLNETRFAEHLKPSQGLSVLLTDDPALIGQSL